MIERTTGVDSDDAPIIVKPRTQDDGKIVTDVSSGSRQDRVSDLTKITFGMSLRLLFTNLQICKPQIMSNMLDYDAPAGGASLPSIPSPSRLELKSSGFVSS